MHGCYSRQLILTHACRPLYNSGTVILAYKALPASDAALPSSGGVANAALQAVSSSSLGSNSGGSDLVTSLPAGTALYNATVFIDAVDIRCAFCHGSL